jgi:hypothetical protein
MVSIHLYLRESTPALNSTTHQELLNYFLAPLLSIKLSIELEFLNDTAQGPFLL